MNEKGISPLYVLGGLILVVAIGAIGLGFVNIQSLSGPDTGGTGTCTSDTQAVLYLTAYNEFSKASITDVNLHLYLEENGTISGALAQPVQNLATDNSFNVTVGKTYTAVFQDDSNTNYAVKKTGIKIPCQTTIEESQAMKPTGSLTFSAWGDDDVTSNSTNNAIGTAQAIANSPVKFKVKMQENTNDQYWNDGIGKPVLCLDYNAVGIVKISIQDVVANPTSTPSGHSSGTLQRANAACFELEKNLWTDYESTYFHITVEPSNTLQPVDSNITGTFYDSALFKNDMGVWGQYYRDPDSTGSVIGGPDGTFTLFTS